MSYVCLCLYPVSIYLICLWYVFYLYCADVRSCSLPLKNLWAAPPTIFIGILDGQVSDHGRMRPPQGDQVLELVADAVGLTDRNSVLLWARLFLLLFCLGWFLFSFLDFLFEFFFFEVLELDLCVRHVYTFWACWSTSAHRAWKPKSNFMVAKKLAAARPHSCDLGKAFWWSPLPARQLELQMPMSFCLASWSHGVIQICCS